MGQLAINGPWRTVNVITRGYSYPCLFHVFQEGTWRIVQVMAIFAVVYTGCCFMSCTNLPIVMIIWWYDTIWYDMIRYDMIYDMIWYMIIWYYDSWWLSVVNQLISTIAILGGRDEQFQRCVLRENHRTWIWSKYLGNIWGFNQQWEYHGNTTNINWICVCISIYIYMYVCIYIYDVSGWKKYELTHLKNTEM